MNEKQILEFCDTHNITLKQYFIVYATSRRWKGYPNEAQLFNKKEPWSDDEIIGLVKKGLLVSSDGSYHPMSLSVNSKFSFENLNNIELGEELWSKYPATFPLGGGGSFVARSTKGQSKDTVIKDYLTRIGNSKEKHAFVLTQLARYVRMVVAGKINGCTIVDFIGNEMWDTVDSMLGEKEVVDKFKVDI